jgi:hypothetical protein
MAMKRRLENDGIERQLIIDFDSDCCTEDDDDWGYEDEDDEELQPSSSSPSSWDHHNSMEGGVRIIFLVEQWG